MAQGQEEPDPALSPGHLQWKIFLWCVQAMYGSLWQEGALHPLGERSVLPWGAACLGQGAGWSTALHGHEATCWKLPGLARKDGEDSSRWSHCIAQEGSAKTHI